VIARSNIGSVDLFKDHLAVLTPALLDQTDALDPHFGIYALAHVTNVGALMRVSGAEWIEETISVDHPSSSRLYRRTAQRTTSRSIQIMVTTPTLMISPFT
jgi:hypothetical protein